MIIQLIRINSRKYAIIIENEKENIRMRRKDRQVTDIETIKDILDSCKTCHVGMISEGIPYVVPLSYGYDISDGILTMYLHSAKEGMKMDALKKNNNVCFEVCTEGKPVYAETPCNSGYYYSSVIGFGKVEFIDDVESKCEALSKMFMHQAERNVEFTNKQADTVCVFKIVSSDFTGKQKPMR